MNFNEYWNQTPAISDKHGPDAKELARTAAARAFHFAQRQERERCASVVERVTGGEDAAPDYVYEFMTTSREQFDAGMQSIVDLTKRSAIEAINSGTK